MPVYSILIVSFWWKWGVFQQADNFFSLIFIEIWNIRCGIWAINIIYDCTFTPKVELIDLSSCKNYGSAHAVCGITIFSKKKENQ
jgi:hypothetical protein